MKKTRFELSTREQHVMDLFWSTGDGLTSVDILEQLNDIMVNPTYVHRSLSALLEKGFIQECGSVRYNKQYARKFKPTLTKEEFAAGLLAEKGMQLKSLKGIAMAFLNQSDDANSQKKQNVINELKQMIDELESGN